jgi:hypothetical protein
MSVMNQKKGRGVIKRRVNICVNGFQTEDLVYVEQ